MMNNKKSEKQMSASNDTRIALLEQSIGHVNETLLRMEKRLDQMDQKFQVKLDNLSNKIDQSEARLEAKIDKIDSRLWALLFWTISGFIGVLALIAHAAHWL